MLRHVLSEDNSIALSTTRNYLGFITVPNHVVMTKTMTGTVHVRYN